MAYTYDGLGRLAERIVTNRNAEETDPEAGKYPTQYVYVDWKDEVDDKGNTTRYTTPLVESILQGTVNNRMDFAYTYDPCNNITSEARNGVVTTYGYDALGQLIRVNDPADPTANDEEIATGTTWVYEYDPPDRWDGQDEWKKEKKEYEKKKAESHQAKDIITGTLAAGAGYMLYQGIKWAIAWGVAGASGGIGLALGFAF